MKQKLSVAVISSPLGKIRGGTTYPFVYEEALNLANRNIEVHLIGRTFIKPSTRNGMHLHGIPKKISSKSYQVFKTSLNISPPQAFLRNPLKILLENLYASAIADIVKKYNLDVIHAHFAYPEGMAALLAKKVTKKPLAVTLHGYDILVDPSIKYGSRLSKKHDLIIRKVVNESDRTLAASNATYKEAQKILNEKEKIVLIHNAVDLKKFNPNISPDIVNEKYSATDKHVIFTLRAHVPKNGIEYLIRAAKLVVEKREDVVFIIGSDGPLRTYHEELAKKLGIKKYIVFTGMIPDSLLPQYYAACDIFVIPSVQEAFGLVASEAMACGKPVIGTNVGGIPDQIVNEVNGFLIPPKNPVVLAEKILYLIEHPNISEKMGQRGRKIVEEKFNLEERITKIIKLYEELAGEKNSRCPKEH